MDERLPDIEEKYRNPTFAHEHSHTLLRIERLPRARERVAVGICFKTFTYEGEKFIELCYLAGIKGEGGKVSDDSNFLGEEFFLFILVELKV